MTHTKLKLGKVIQELEGELTRLRRENAELEALFELQHTRVGEATRLWQAETGRHDVLPDLGRLVEWLLERGNKSKRYLWLPDLVIEYSDGQREYYLKGEKIDNPWEEVEEPK